MAEVNTRKIKSSSLMTNKSSDYGEKSSSNDIGVRRSNRKRKRKQFHDFEVDLFHSDKVDLTDDDKDLDEQNRKKMHKGNTEAKFKTEKDADNLEFSVSKQNHKQSSICILDNENRLSVITSTTTEQKPKSETVSILRSESSKKKSIPKSKMIKSDISRDFSPMLKQLIKSGGILYKCSSQDCSKTFLCFQKLDVHKKTTHGENIRHICTECGKNFGTYFLFRTHIRMEHSELQSLMLTLRNAEVEIKDENSVGGRKIMVCTKCGYRYGEREDPDHMCEPEELRYYCPCCDYHTIHEAQMQSHLSENHIGEFHEIKDIDRYADLRSSAKEPGWNIDQNSTKCEICNLQFMEFEELKQHMNVKHAKHPFACGVCKTCYGRKTALKKHMMSHRKTDLTCSVCKKEFYEKSRLAVHMLTHTGERPHQCEVCGNRYCDEKAVRKHIAIKHPDYLSSKDPTNNENKVFKNKTLTPSVCHLCGKSFTSMALLNKHLKTHNKSDVYKCPHCDMTFSEISALKQHKLSHQALDFSQTGGIKTISNQAMQEVFKEIQIHEEGHPSGLPYKCGICDKRFSKLKCVRRHIRVIHMKEEDKSFVCAVCKRGFTLSAALRTHMRLHTKAKPYRCRICHKQFRQLGHVKDHLLHHGKPHLECAICKRMFKSRGSLRRHVRVHCKVLPFVCPARDCSLAFQSLFLLLEHLSTCQEFADAEEILECNFCHQKFKKNTITGHYHEHEKDVKFTCETCCTHFDSYQRLYFHKEQKKHFLESEFEAPGNKNVVNRTNLQDYAAMDAKDLLSQYDYIKEEEDAEQATYAIIEEGEIRNSEQENRVNGIDVNTDGDLILIAEQLTYMASGFPYREVIVQSAENEEDGTVTEITIQDLDIVQQTEQADVQEEEQVLYGEMVEACIEVVNEQAITNEEPEKVYVKVEPEGTPEETEQKPEDGPCEDMLRANEAEFFGKKENVTVDEPKVNNDCKVNSAVINSIKDEDKINKTKNKVDKELKEEKLCPNCQYTFPDEASFDKHVCEEAEIEVELDTDSNYEVKKKTKVTKRKRNIGLKESTMVSEICSSGLSSMLKELYKRRAVIYICTTKTCSRRFHSINKIMRHKKFVHKEILKYLCSQCEKLFGSFYVFKSHIRMEHSDLDKVPFHLKNTKILIKGKAKTVGGGIVVCTKCGYRYGSLEDPRHECEPTQLRYYCPCFQYHSDDLSQISKHISENHEDEFKKLNIRDRYACLRSVNREPGSLISERAKTCDVCDITFNTNDKLIQHLNTKHAKHPFACGLCKTCYGRKSALFKHLSSHKKSDVKCSVCQKEFLEQSRLDVHMLTHTGQRPFQCEVCGNRYLDEKTVRKHIRMKHLDNFKASYPDSAFTNSVKKKKVNARTPTICHVCGKTFPSELRLKRHMHDHRREEVYKCPHCDLTFDEVAAFKKHKSSHQMLDLSVDVNGKGLSHAKMQELFKGVEVYDEKHPSGLPYKCGMCEKRFSKLKSVHRHIRLIHMKEEDKTFVCHICKRGFTLSAALRTHMRLHANSKPYKCRLCHKKFRQVGHIKDHLLHHGKAHLKCTLCDKMFKSKGNLHRHMKTHCKTFPFQCPKPGCKAGFLSLFPFLTHCSECLDSIDVKSKLECNICKQSFLASNIISHYHTHENDAIFTCEMCGMAFDNYQRLFYHKEKSSHFMESEFVAPRNNRNTIAEEEDDRLKESWAFDVDDLLNQYDYIEEEDCSFANKEKSGKIEQSTKSTDVDLVSKVEEVIAHELNGGEIILTADQLAEITSAVAHGEVIVQGTQGEEISEITEIAEIAIADGAQGEGNIVYTEMDSAQEVLFTADGTLPRNTKVYSITKPDGNEEVTYYILALDSPQTS